LIKQINKNKSKISKTLKVIRIYNLFYIFIFILNINLLSPGVLISQYLIKIANNKSISEKIFEFDILIKSTAENFILTSYQLVMTCDSNFTNSGNLSFSYINNSSDMMNYPCNSIGIRIENNIQKMCLASGPGYILNDTIKNYYKKIGTFRLLNSNSFNFNKSRIDWVFSNDIVTLLTGRNYFDITNQNNFSNLNNLLSDFNIPELIFNEDDSLQLPKKYFDNFTNNDSNTNNFNIYSFSSGKFVTAKWDNNFLTLKANPDWFGIDSIKITVSNDIVNKTTTIGVKVISVNDLPSIKFKDTLKIVKNVPFIFNLWNITNDIETSVQNLNFEFTFNNKFIIANYDHSNGNLIISPNEAPLGNYKLFLTVKDKESAISKDTINIIVSNSSTFVGNNIPDDFIVYQNFPNPFNNSTVVKYTIPVTSEVVIVLHNLLGQNVIAPVYEIKQKGKYEYFINDDNLSSGIYFLSVKCITIDSHKIFTNSIKILLIK
jgi:hypothetical protein